MVKINYKDGLLQMKCPSCQADIQEGSRFCANCGTRIEEVTAPPSSPFRHAQIYEGARKRLTVLFADVKGSTALAVEQDPEETLSSLKLVLQIMIESVGQYNGTVIKVAGDGIMALFGAPIALEDHAIRACYAALSMQKKMNEKKSGISIRVGINSGEVVVDTIGTDERKEYDAMGLTVNIAARMEQLAEPGMVQITPQTLGLVKRQVSVAPRGKMEAKGLPKPIEAFELLGITQNFSGFGQKKSGQLSEFIDRKPEMQKLEFNLEQTLNGQGNCCALLGEPGVGKSRLAFEFVNSPTNQSIASYESQCLSVTKNSPLFSIKQLIKSFFGINDEALEDQIPMIDKKLKLYKKITPLCRNSALSILDLPIEDSEWNALTPESKLQRAMDGFVELFTIVSNEEPLIIFVENIQWIDGESSKCFNKFINILSDNKIFLLYTVRPGFANEWSKNPHFSEIKVNPLTNNDFGALANSILGMDLSVRNLKNQLIDRCNGNPFFLEETIQSLLDHRRLEGEYGKFRLGVSLKSLVLPRSVQAVIDARVDQLSYNEKQILQTCSVIGYHTPLKLLKLLINLSEEYLNNALEVLQNKNLLSKTQEFPEVVFSFTQILIQEAVYNSLLLKRRKQMHLEILECMENNFPDDREELIVRKADHALKGGDWEKALNYYITLADKDYEQSVTVEGLEHYKRAALAYHRIVNPTDEQHKQFIHICHRKVHLSFWSGNYGGLRKPMNEALEIAKKHLHDPLIEAQLMMSLARTYHQMGKYEEISTICLDTLKFLEGKKGGYALQILRTDSSFNLFHAYFYMGEYQKALEHIQCVLDYVKDPFARDQLSGTPFWTPTKMYQLQIHGVLGNFETSKKVEQEILLEIKDKPPSMELTSLETLLGISFCHRGDMSQAATHTDLGLELASKMQLFILYGPALSTKGFILSLQNKAEEAQECLDKSFDIAKEKDFTFKTIMCLNFLCEGYLNLNRIERAKTLMEKMFELAEKRKQKGLEVYAWRYRAEIESVEGTNPEQSFMKAIQLAEERGMLPEVAHSYRGLFRFYTKANEPEKAGQAFTAANDLYRSMGMKYWPEKMQGVKNQ